MSARMATYTGTERPDLKDKTALLCDAPNLEGRVLAQFDDRQLKEAFGWWQFPAADFVVTYDPDVPTRLQKLMEISRQSHEGQHDLP